MPCAVNVNLTGAPILWPAAPLPLHQPAPCQGTRAKVPCPMNHPPADSLSWACQAHTTGHSPFAPHGIQVFALEPIMEWTYLSLGRDLSPTLVNPCGIVQDALQDGREHLIQENEHLKGGSAPH